jgi:hypothetical protein
VDLLTPFMFDRLVLGHCVLQMVRVAFAVGVFAAFLVFGRLCAKRLVTAEIEPLPRAILEIAFGFAAYATLVRLAAAASLGVRGYVLALLLVPALLALRDRGLRRAPGFAPANHGPRALKLATFAIALLPLPMALAPAVSLDALTYQLRVPEMALRTGSWPLDLLDSHTFFPAATQCVYMAALAFDGSGITAQLVHFGFFLLTLLGLAALAARLEAGACSWWSSLFFASIPTAGIVAGWSWSDMPLCFALVAAALAVSYGEGAGAIVALALAASIKYSGLLLALPLLACLPFRARGGRMLGQRWILGAAAALAILAPWYGANVVAAGNPFYPLLSGVFHGPRAAEGNLLHWASGGRDRGFGTMWHYVIAPDTLDGDIGGLGLGVLLGAALIHGFSRRGLRGASAAVAAGAGALAFFEPSPRILLPVLAGGCVLASAALADWTRGGRRQWVKIGAAALVARGGLLVAGHNALFFNPVPAAVGIESERAYVARHFPPSRLYERAAALPENSVVLSVGEPRLFGFPRRSLNSAITDPPAAQPFLANAEAPSEVLRRLRAQRVTHLLVELDWLSRPGTLPSATAAIRLTAREERLMRQVIELSTPVDREGPLLLLALPS